MLRPAVKVSAWMLALTACGGDTATSPDVANTPTPLTQQVETAHFVFHFAPGDTVDSERQEAFHEWVVPRLGASPPQKLQYYKYLSRDHMFSLTGRGANGFAEPEQLEVHSIFPWHAHESVHVYSALVGRPSDFFNEGLAVALSIDPLADRFEGSYSGEPVHQWARRNQNQLQPVEDMVTTDAFRRLDEALAYQEAGSFMEFLLDTEGFGPTRELFRQGQREHGLEAIRTLFLESFGFSLTEAERRWRVFLESGG